MHSSQFDRDHRESPATCSVIKVIQLLEVTGKMIVDRSAVVLMEETSRAAPPLRAHFLIGNKGISMPISQSDEHQKSREHIRIFHLHHRCLAQAGPQYALKKYLLK